MAELKRLCVFCGSRTGDDPRYREAAIDLAQLFAEEGIGLVYGAGSVGIMGVLADAALDLGLEVIGVIPGGLFEREIAHPGLTELHEVSSMHERKKLMYDLSDGFITLPGGLGTLDEFAEIATWSQIGIHRDPVAILDVDGYFAPLVSFLDGAVREGFLSQANRELILYDDDARRLIQRMRDWEPPPSTVWLDDIDQA